MKERERHSRNSVVSALLLDDADLFRKNNIPASLSLSTFLNTHAHTHVHTHTYTGCTFFFSLIRSIFGEKCDKSKFS